MTSLEFTTPGPTTIRIERTFDAPLELVWRAHTDPALVKRWMTGPPDHSLPICEIDLRVGGTCRYVWKNREFEMGMSAEFLEIVAHQRTVHTELFDGWPEGKSTVTTEFLAEGAGTRVRVTIEYLSQDARDAAMQPGFREGYEASYQSLEALLREPDVKSSSRG